MPQPPTKSSSPVFKILLAVFACGFLVFACCVGWFGYTFYQGFLAAKERAQANASNKQAISAHDSSGEAGFKVANGQIGANTGSPARGNSETAIKLAGAFSKDIRTLREAFFTKRKKQPLFSLSDGEFLTYCHLDDEACVFLVRVPDLRKFKKEAKADLADLAWATAQQVARANLDSPPPKLAVGVRGVILYDTAMIGKLQSGDEEGAGDGIETRQSGSSPEKLLYSFFKADVVPEVAHGDDTPVAEGMSEGDPATDDATPESEEK